MRRTVRIGAVGGDIDFPRANAIGVFRHFFQVFRLEHIGVGARIARFDEIIRANGGDTAVFVHVIRVQQVNQRHFGHFFQGFEVGQLKGLNINRRIGAIQTVFFQNIDQFVFKTQTESVVPCRMFGFWVNADFTAIFFGQIGAQFEDFF